MSWNDLIGQRIGPYEIIEELGRGGSSRVYRAYQESLRRYVAIKVLSNDSEDRQGFVRRFEREVEVVAKLSHPNIVAVYESGEFEDLVYLVMQCVTGGTLRQRLGRPLPIAGACAAMIQMARALHHAHLHGIIHRDVKPSNMLIDADENGRLLLTDFGIAKLQGMRGLTKSGTTVGTPEYMAPEQAEGGEIDARVDVYSLGCVLYEALAGRPPFIGATPVSVLYQHVHSRPSYIRGFNPQVPRELARVLDLALAKRPEERFATAESFAHALHPFTGGREQASFSLPLSGALAPAEAPSAPDGLDLRTPPPREPLRLPDTGLGTRQLEEPDSVPADALPRTGAAASEPLHGLSGEGPDTLPRPAAAASEPLHGLGAEGLDALFPDDPEAQEAREARAREEAPGELANLPDSLAGPLPGAALPPEALAPSTRPPAGPRPTIPLMAFRLPARDTGSHPLALPLTSDGQVDMEALMAEVDRAPIEPTVLPPTSFREFGGSDDPPGSDTHQLDLGDQGDAVSSWGDEGDEGGESASGSQEAMRSTSASSVTVESPPPVWRPETLELPAGPRWPRFKALSELRRLWAGLAAVTLLALALGTFAAVRAAGQRVVATPTATPAPTVTPTALPTATPLPLPTATLTQQQILNQQAAAAFRAITLQPFRDTACARTASSFSASQSVYVNLCVAGSAQNGHVTVLLRQNSRTVSVMAQDYPVYSGGFAYFWTLPYELAPGTYDILIMYNGGVAADPSLTVTHG
jgi:serine/threonine protein kinase